MSTPNTSTPKQTNPYRLKVSELAYDLGYESTSEFLEAECQDSVVPACCKEGCEVEPDGRCEHGCPSPLLALGLI